MLLRRLRNRAKFALERWMVRGARHRLLIVAALIALVALGGGVIALLFGEEFSGVGDAVWWAFLRLTDPGYLGDDEGAARRTVSTILTILGYVLFLGALIAIMTQWLNETLADLESGLTPIALSDHILILGWTNRTAGIVQELLLSEGRVRRFLRNRGSRALRIVILVDHLTLELVHELRERLGALWTEDQVIFRSGTPLRIEHLERVDFLNAAAIVVPGADFAGTTDASRPEREKPQESQPPAHAAAGATDTRTIKTLLSISSHPAARRAGAGLPAVVAEIMDARKETIARGAYDGSIEIIASDLFISRLIVQNVRHPGLSGVYSELLTHGRGNEIYIRHCPELAGARVQDLAAAFPDAVVLGVVRSGPAGFRPFLNPPAGFILEPHDRLALLARSYSDSELRGSARPQERNGQAAGAPPAETRRILILGWSHKVPDLLREFDSYGNERFTVDILSAVSGAKRAARLARHEAVRLGNVQVRQHEGDYTVPGNLSALAPESFDNIVLLGSDWLRNGEESDARTIMGYLLLHEMLEGSRPGPQLLVELLDPQNVSLFRQREGEVLISPSILSHILAQVALRPELRAVYDQLFGAGGAEISFRPAAAYAVEGQRLCFRELQEQAAARGETALGLQRTEHRIRDLQLNPPREQQWQVGSGDEVVLLTAK